ncbi:hypothetical protein [Methylobacterium nigriterrae]|uniref:hypothetical protein n=1 Tax=Methylobacterium nigriterrae TaxID=3127512 RepID=UPI0030133668
MSEHSISHAEALEMARHKATDSNLARRYIELHAEHARLREAAEAARGQMCRSLARDPAYAHALDALDAALRSPVSWDEAST